MTIAKIYWHPGDREPDDRDLRIVCKKECLTLEMVASELRRAIAAGKTLDIRYSQEAVKCR